MNNTRLTCNVIFHLVHFSGREEKNYREGSILVSPNPIHV